MRVHGSFCCHLEFISSSHLLLDSMHDRKNPHHPGNERFKIIINMKSAEYGRASSRLEKTQIVKEVVQVVRTSGGNFVRYEESQWLDIGNLRAREKAGHALRAASRSSRPAQAVASVASASATTATTTPTTATNQAAPVIPSDQPSSELEGTQSHGYGSLAPRMPPAFPFHRDSLQPLDFTKAHTNFPPEGFSDLLQNAFLGQPEHLENRRFSTFEDEIGKSKKESSQLKRKGSWHGKSLEAKMLEEGTEMLEEGTGYEADDQSTLL